MSDFKAPRLSWPHIREIARNQRIKYSKSPSEIPVPIEEIIEFKLKLTIVPQLFLKEEFGIDGQLLSDLSTIIIDSAMYFNDKLLPRVRFTLAHELGHFFLHRDQIIKTHFSSVTEWIEFRQGIPEEDISWFENQADEFAGSFLVPASILNNYLENNRHNIEEYIKNSSSGEAHEEVINKISWKLCAEFGVSHSVIETRIRKEKMWEELGFYNI